MVVVVSRGLGSLWFFCLVLPWLFSVALLSRGLGVCLSWGRGVGGSAINWMPVWVGGVVVKCLS